MLAMGHGTLLIILVIMNQVVPAKARPVLTHSRLRIPLEHPSAPHISSSLSSSIQSSSPPLPPHHRYQHPQISPIHTHHRYHAPPILHKNLDKIINRVGALAAAKRYIAVMFGPLRLIFLSNHWLTNIPWSFAYYWQWTRLRLDIRCYIFAVGAAVCEGFLGGVEAYSGTSGGHEVVM